MNINEDFQPNPNINAEDAMNSSMGFLFENFIKPMEHELTEDQTVMLGLIGVAFKMIAEKATAYEKMIEGNGEDFYKN